MTTKIVTCAYCGKKFAKACKRINQTIKNNKRHSCSRKCASDLTNETRRCEPSTANAINTRNDKAKFPAKNHARYLVRKAIQTGKLIALEECEMCGSEHHIEGHHPDHSCPFLLLYLCKNCHRKADAEPDRWIDLATDYSECV